MLLEIVALLQIWQPHSASSTTFISTLLGVVYLLGSLLSNEEDEDNKQNVVIFLLFGVSK